GIMISASHNSFEDNGIKFFGPDGFKLTDAQEAEIENLMNQEDTLPRPQGEDLGLLSKYFEGSQKYLSYLQDTVDNDFTDLYIGPECANGSSSSRSTRMFADQDSEIAKNGKNSNRTNTNECYRSAHSGKMAGPVKEKGTDVGLSFDG